MKYVLVVSINKKPHTYNKVVVFPEWRKAMIEEIKALEQNETWEVFNPSQGKKPIGCRWVYKIKYNVGGEVEHYKAMLVAKGYTQLEGIDYLYFLPCSKIDHHQISPCHLPCTKLHLK